MKKLKLLIMAFALSILIVNCKNEAKNETKNEAFTLLTQNYFKDKNDLNPFDATSAGLDGYNDKLVFEMTDSYRKQQAAFYDKYQKQLSSIAVDELSEDEKISYEIIKWETADGQDFLKLEANLIPIHQFWGTHLLMTQYASGTSSQPFKTEKDYRDFLKRMDTYTVWIDSAMVYMKRGIQKGQVLPKALTVKVIPQFSEQITTKVQENLFYAAIKIMPKNFTETQKKALARDYAAVIMDKLIPSYKRMLAFLKTSYLSASRTTSGIGSLPNGKALYAAHVKHWTTTTMNPDQIHELGLAEVARLKMEMEKVKTQVGFKRTLLDFFEEVRNKKALMPFKKPEEVIANFEAIHNKIKPNVDKLFSLQPKTKFEIRRTEAFREQTASAEYQQSNADGTRPGIFYVPIPDVTTYNFYGDEDLFLHEAIPGHHFQISLQQENAALPDFRKFAWFGAYGEGWALYTESLGKELGLYSDPYQYFGMLGNEMHRAVRLVVDTGLHSKGWTREQAIQFSLENEAESKASITTEIERYMAIPGQALSYKIGQLKIMELRKKAQEKLKDKFDIKVFHQKVLESGVLPLALLEKKIDHWMVTEN
jgi:uncharacterized protein (DUF885 family)